MPVSQLPYWLVNVPEGERPESCPVWLQNRTERDVKMLSTPDADYTRLGWPQIAKIIQDNRLDSFGRYPSDLRRYFEFSYNLKQKWGSVLDFVKTRRLKWSNLSPADTTPFANSDDVKILYNDWPYGFEPQVKHLVVWVKSELPEDPATGDLTDDCRARIQTYVDQTFGDAGPGPENVLWFRNWSAIKSVHAIEHFHVLIYGADSEYLTRVTNGDVPLHELDAAGLEEILKK